MKEMLSQPGLVVSSRINARSVLSPLLLACALVPASAQTITTSSANYLHNYLTWSRVTDTVKPTNGDVWAGANMYDIGGADYFEFCVEAYTGGSWTTYTVTQNLDSIYSATKASQLRALVENAMPEFIALRDAYLALEPSGNYNATYDDAFDQFTGYSAAMQFGMWEILQETSGSLNLQAGELTSGSYYLSGNYPVGTITGAERAQFYGIQIADKLQNGTWTDPGAGAGNYVILHGNSDTYQDRLFITAVPEPTSIGLALSSAGLLLFRRRRRTTPADA